jgi:hypothetical protein
VHGVVRDDRAEEREEAEDEHVERRGPPGDRGARERRQLRSRSLMIQVIFSTLL